jgi:Zn-finger protein
MNSIPELVICPKCGISKPLIDYYANASYLSGRATNQCKKCHVKHSVEQAKNNLRTKAYKAKWYQDNKERLSEEARKYREINKNEIARKKQAYDQLNKEKSKIRLDRWKANHPDGVNAISRRRRAKVNGVISDAHTEQDVLNIWGMDCHLCNKPIDLDAPRSAGKPGWEWGLHLDHVIPINVGGPNTIDNVKPAHGLCNLRKAKR